MRGVVFCCFAVFVAHASTTLRRKLGARPVQCSSEIATTCALQIPYQLMPSKEASRKKVAVLIVGTRQRFYPVQTLRHVVAPASRAGYDVDYFALLSWAPADKGKAGAKSSWSASWLKAQPNPLFANATRQFLQDYVLRHAKHYGAKQVYLYILEEDVIWDALAPTWDRLLGRDTRSSTAFFNSVVRFKKVEMLWNRTLAASAASGSAYSYVMLTRDDMHWVGDVHLRHFGDDHTVYAISSDGKLCQKAGNSSLPSDHVYIMSGRSAARFLMFYTEFYTNPSKQLTNVGSVEMFLENLAILKGLRWRIVTATWLPYFLSVHTSGYEPHKPPTFCLRHLQQKLLEKPEGPCVHPKQVPHIGCVDFLG